MRFQVCHQKEKKILWNSVAQLLDVCGIVIVASNATMVMSCGASSCSMTLTHYLPHEKWPTCFGDDITMDSTLRYSVFVTGRSIICYRTMMQDEILFLSICTHNLSVLLHLFIISVSESME